MSALPSTESHYPAPSAAGVLLVGASRPDGPTGSELLGLPEPPELPDLEPPARIVARLRAAGCVFAEDEARLLVAAARTPAELDAMTARRVGGLPLEHVLGWAAFCGLRVAVDPGVFVPRRRTEFMVREAAALALARVPAGALGRAIDTRPLVVLDLCCGSGALGAALAHVLRVAAPGTATGAADASGPPGGVDVELHACDVDPAAIACARRNIAAHGGRAYLGDLFAPLPARLRGRVDILLANAPYVPSGEVGLLPAEAREYEPLVALDGGADGLDVLRRVARAAPHWLAPGGALLVETSGRQAPAAAADFAAAGLAARVAESEEFYATVVVGTRPA